jgi:MoaA/NifB/PqqE/SkfB family radical SAM enzyme
MPNYSKTPETIVLRGYESATLRLIHQTTQETIDLNETESGLWEQSDFENMNGLFGRLNETGFVKPIDFASHSVEPQFDHIFPAIKSIYVKWYEESPDMIVLFNSESMRTNNPLLVLGAYGSLCWRGIMEGLSVDQIRIAALQEFGVDEVIPFLKRLASLNFINAIPELDIIDSGEEKIVKEFSAPDVQFMIFRSRIPWYCLWEMCTKCNLRCDICYLPDFKSAGPSEEEAIRIARDIVDSGIFYVSLIGGEPMIRKDLIPIVNFLRSNGVFVKIITNGQLITEENARLLAEAKLNLIEISLDGMTSETHDASRGEGSFQKCMDAIRIVREAGIPRTAVVFTAHSGNFKDFPQLPASLREWGISDCYISLFKKTGQMGSHSKFDPLNYLDVEVLKGFVNSWEDEYPDLKVTLLPSCSCGKTSAIIGANGELRFCSFSTTSVGSISENPLLQVWQGKDYNSEQMIRKSGYCKKLENTIFEV